MTLVKITFIIELDKTANEDWLLDIVSSMGGYDVDIENHEPPSDNVIHDLKTKKPRHHTEPAPEDGPGLKNLEK